jgi:hypothetical protein
MEQVMGSMGDQMMRDFCERWRAVAAIEAEEQRTASVILRWQQTNAILRLAIGLGLSLGEPDESEQAVYYRWARLKGMQG